MCLGRKLRRRVIDCGGPVHRAAVGYQPIRKIDLGDSRSPQPNGCRPQKKYFFGFRPALRIILILFGVVVQPFAKLTAATTMHDRLIPVYTKRLRYIILISIEISDNDSLTEGRGHKGRQQKKGCALS